MLNSRSFPFGPEKNSIGRLGFAHTHKILGEFIRYGIVGGLAFVVDFGLLYFLTSKLGFHYLSSATLSFVAGSIVNYLLCISFVFLAKAPEPLGSTKITLFFAIGLAGLTLNNALIWFGVSFLGLHYLVSKAISAVAVLAFNFFLRRQMVFS